MEQFVDYYAILGVSSDATTEEIKKAYRKLSREYHPDLHQGEKDEKDYSDMQARLNVAWKILGNVKKRAIYDMQYIAYQREKQAQASSRNSYSDRKDRNGKAERTTRTTTQESTAQPQEAPEKVTLRKCVNDVKKAWQEVRTEEKKAKFFNRHKTLDGNIHRNFYKKNRNRQKTFFFHLQRGTLHIIGEALYQLEKITHITEDTIPKFLIRNRRAVALAILIVLLASSAKMNSEDYEAPAISPESYSTEATYPSESIDFKEVFDSDKQEQQEQERINQEYKVYRRYEVQAGDTLYHLAQNSNSSVEEIQKSNGLDSDVIHEGTTILIPYYIKSGDLMYATVAAYRPEGMDLGEFARAHSTDVGSIGILNGGAIREDMDTLLVPTFATQQEIDAQKATTEKSYVKK